MTWLAIVLVTYFAIQIAFGVANVGKTIELNSGAMAVQVLISLALIILVVLFL
jgi:hypothetical protein